MADRPFHPGKVVLPDASRPRIAFGPERPDFGSWRWIGEEMAEALRTRFETVTFEKAIPEADVVVFVKFRPEADVVRHVAERSAVIYCPVDSYGSADAIDADERFLTRCDQIVVHCHRLRKYFASYAPTEYRDHHLRFVAPLRKSLIQRGPILWAGVHSNLPPLVEWVNRNRLPEELWVLTNLSERESLDPSVLGFRNASRVRVERWTAERHCEWTALARGAIDIKGSDFRARHKPPVKAFDFIASGVPFATNSWSSPADHLSGLGFTPTSPVDVDRWLSRTYFEETAQLGRVLREHLTRELVAESWATLIESVLERRRNRPCLSAAVPSPRTDSEPRHSRASSAGPARRPMRVALLSLLFNWPSTGGGTIHTFEAAKFLSRAGYDVQHIYARQDGWRLGQVTEPLAAPSVELRFDDHDWNPDTIRTRFRAALDDFQPDAVIVTDSWNTKPLLAEAAIGYPTYLRLAAQECLCPLNNVRLLADAEGRATACPRHQLASPGICRQCVASNACLSGGLHQAERALAGFNEADYPRRLHDAFARAAGILAVNPAIADLVRPFAKAVHVVPSGFDPQRFDLSRLDANPPPKSAGKSTLFFAGLTQEYMKGFHILEAACEVLWQSRQDFELVATADPPEQARPYSRFIGWLSQDELPRHIRAADILVFPTLAEEALGRSAVEAMACGRPVVASRIGGLPFTVRDGENGLLFEPGNVDVLAETLSHLMDDAALRERLGAAGRARFEAEYTWDAILSRHYARILGPVSRPVSVTLDPVPSWANAPRLGCVLAVHDRPADVLERTLQTYAFQSPPPADKVLVDFGSRPDLADEYQRLADRYGWRLHRVGPTSRPWSLSAAYNMAVSRLAPDIDVVFKGDVDVLLGKGVLEAAARHGGDSLCLFACRTTQESTPLPERFDAADDVSVLLAADPPPVPMDGEGIHAYPRAWFEKIGGFDLAFSGWGYEDSDLRLRAEASIGVHRDTSALLIHQWHPRTVDSDQSRRNHDYYQGTKSQRQIVRNGGRLTPEEISATEPVQTEPASETGSPSRVVIATRSLDEALYRISHEFLDFSRAEPSELRPTMRHRLEGTDAAGYLREMAQIDADWIVNLDEDAFVLDPDGILALVDTMRRDGYAACGMPDGGVVPIRRHHPLACNTFFNVFDARCIRALWKDWPQVLQTDSPRAGEARMAPFARRTPFEFDRFEPYYPAFFSLLSAGERILYLDAETWDDGISTLLKGPDGQALLIHCWYARLWRHDPATRDRYARALTFARATRHGGVRPVLAASSASRTHLFPITNSGRLSS
ncbi:MAG: glycosyltransferase [Planctomycetaceae bacterium]|nr:glycosyltransferase [Planctomycetaceae bacterium]